MIKGIQNVFGFRDTTKNQRGCFWFTSFEAKYSSLFEFDSGGVSFYYLSKMKMLWSYIELCVKNKNKQTRKLKQYRWYSNIKIQLPHIWLRYKSFCAWHMRIYSKSHSHLNMAIISWIFYNTKFQFSCVYTFIRHPCSSIKS